MHTLESAGSGANHGRILLEAAAHLIEKRVGSLRGGAAPLHPIEELDLAAQAIRRLAAELGRIHEARLAAEGNAGAAPQGADEVTRELASQGAPEVRSEPAPQQPTAVNSAAERPAPVRSPPVLAKSSKRRAA